MTLWLTAVLLIAPLVSAQDPADDPDDVEPAAASEPAPAPDAPAEPAPAATAQPRMDPVDAEQDPADDDVDADSDEQRDDDESGRDDDGHDYGRSPGDDVADGPLDEAAEGGTGVLFGSSIGYALGGALPALGFGAGGTVLFIAANAANETGDPCASAVYMIAGILVATLLVTPSAIACGPCTAMGAALGSGVGAAMSDRELSWPMLGALPGLVVGVAGSTLICGGLLFAANTGEPFATGELALGAGFAAALTGVGLALLAGPIAVAGATLADLQQDQERSLRDAAASSTAPLNEPGPATALRGDDEPVLSMAY